MNIDGKITHKFHMILTNVEVFLENNSFPMQYGAHFAVIYANLF